MPLDTSPSSRQLRERLADLIRPVRRGVLARRRLLAALCAGVAVLAGFRAAAPPSPETVPVTVAARGLPAGTVLGATDVMTVEYAGGTAPDGVVRDPVGRGLAGPIGRGEPLTRTRLVGPGLSDGHPDLVAMPVRFPDSAMADLLQVGDRVDVLAADPQGGPPATISTAALVLALPRPPAETTADGLPGRLVVLGVVGADVPAVVDASVTRFLAFAYSR